MASSLSPLALHIFATCESGGPSFVVRLGFDTLERAQTAHQFIVDSARTKPDPVPAWFDVKALEVARRFTLDTEPQRRASLQVAVVEAMQVAAPAAPTPPAAPADEGTDTLDGLRAEIADLEAKLEEARQAPWPEWATAVLQIVREHSGYDGYDDQDQGVDLPEEVREHCEVMARENTEFRTEIQSLRAQLAAPPAAGDEARQITLTAPQLRQALDFVNPDKGDADQQEDRLTIAWAKERVAEGETHPAGLYAWFTEYPEEGAIYLDPEDPAPETMPFEVRIAGPDDVIPFADELDAHRRANIINQQHVADCLKNPSPEAYVMCVATVHPAEAGKVGE